MIGLELSPDNKFAAAYTNNNQTTLQRQFRLYIPFLGIVRPQPQFPHSCVFERFIYSQDQSRISSSRTGRPIVGIYNSLTDT